MEILDFAKKLIDLKETSVKQFGEIVGEEFFSGLLIKIQFQIRTTQIIQELDLFKNLYVDSIFSITEKFYELNFKKEQTENEKELMKGVYEIIGKPDHKFSDEITLLFYVGLYHKIENYENEILKFYNAINNTNFKELKSVGIDYINKKNLFEDRDRIRLICNSIKHNNYYPKKELLKFYPYLEIDKKISLINFNPIEDIELIKAYVHYFNMLVTLKMALTKYSNYNNIMGQESPNELESHFNELMKDKSYKDEDYKTTYLNK
ncbi:hypothetical protein FEDK69T_30160 [Flavobacterium enshiense DK69]|uniref:Uncharacterized protein n=1 Tax=Flavobacterium enshiense DK69 TaxID=1107311 RepID=V6S1T2_9FLAO|nr:hypothetical protein [Flavobacterium enshiense]ESU20202.1 hypothetical protein FEDK69T_30160 [Flavobacterium enshiense DK69]KGO91619.1 hypothetical protein Q767_15915 [Flavobacterium enshiense DK69]